jgi:hypothetical protein
MRSRRPDPAVLLRMRAIEHFRRQVATLREVYPTLIGEANGTALVVSGEVQPTELSDTYRIRVVYILDEAPKVYVEEPALRPRDDGAEIPHVYPGPRPCLYLPNNGEWTGKEALAETIIPWLLLWLFYYELWHATGVWQGGGEHPQPQENPPTGA